MTDEEKKALQTFVIDGMPRTVDEIKSRRKKKGDFQYEVSWRNLPSIKYNKWFMREVRRRCTLKLFRHALLWIYAPLVARCALCVDCQI